MSSMDDNGLPAEGISQCIVFPDNLHAFFWFHLTINLRVCEAKQIDLKDAVESDSNESKSKS